MPTTIALSHLITIIFSLLVTLLILLMGVGVTLWHTGMVRSRNSLTMVAQALLLLCIVSLVYPLFGVPLMWLWPDTWLHLKAILTGHFPSFDAFSYPIKLMTGFGFCWISVLIMAGFLAERVRLWNLAFFTVIFSGITFPLMGYWVWGAGWLWARGFVDAGGAGVIYLSATAASFAALLWLRPRVGRFYEKEPLDPMPGANIPLAMLGALVWVTAGSVLLGATADLLPSLAGRSVESGFIHLLNTQDALSNTLKSFLNAQMAIAGAGLVALTLTRFFSGKSDMTIGVNGMLAGLIAISADPVHPALWWALSLGVISGVLVIIMVKLLSILCVDDPVGAFMSYGVAAIWGLLAVPISNSTGNFGSQVIGIIAIFFTTFVISSCVWLFIKFLVGLGLKPGEQKAGMDILDCGLQAYPEFIKRL